MTDDNILQGRWRCALCHGTVEGEDHSECAEAFLRQQQKVTYCSCCGAPTGVDCDPTCVANESFDDSTQWVGEIKDGLLENEGEKPLDPTPDAANVRSSNGGKTE